MDHKLSPLSLSFWYLSIFFLLYIYLPVLTWKLNFLFYYVFTLCWVNHSRFDISYISSSHQHYFMCNTRYSIVLCLINLILFVLLIFADLVFSFSHHYLIFYFVCFCCVLLVYTKAFCDHVDNFYSHLIRYMYNDIQ